MSGRSTLVSEKPSSIEELLRLHRRIAIDSNVLIYLLEGNGARAELAARLADAVGRGEVDGVLSSIGLAEVLVAAAKADEGPVFEEIAATIRDLGLRIVALDASAAEDAAWIRGRTGATMPDAIHLACARRAGVTVFVTNDRRMPALSQLEIVVLDDLAT
jgi:predicted nucleic acid-binding protein